MTGWESEFRVQRYVGCGGIELVGDVGGDPASPAILLLHGGGQTRHSWSETMRKLVLRGYHVVNPDARGHGDSDWAPDGDYSIETLARDVACIARTLPAKPALVGASMGGAASLFLAGSSQEPIAAALVLVDMVPQMDARGVKRIRSFMSRYGAGFETLQEAADAVAAYNPHRPRPTTTSGLMKNLRRRQDGRLYWHWDPRLIRGSRATDPLVLVELLQAAAERVRIPTLLVHGLRSDIVTDAGVADLRRRIADMEVVDIATAGHMVAGDDNDIFSRGLIDFLQRRLPPRTPRRPASRRHP